MACTRRTHPTAHSPSATSDNPRGVLSRHQLPDRLLRRCPRSRVGRFHGDVHVPARCRNKWIGMARLFEYRRPNSTPYHNRPLPIQALQRRQFPAVAVFVVLVRQPVPPRTPARSAPLAADQLARSGEIQPVVERTLARFGRVVRPDGADLLGRDARGATFENGEDRLPVFFELPLARIDDVGEGAGLRIPLVGEAGRRLPAPRATGVGSRSSACCSASIRRSNRRNRAAPRSRGRCCRPRPISCAGGVIAAPPPRRSSAGAAVAGLRAASRHPTRTDRAGTKRADR